MDDGELDRLPVETNPRSKSALTYTRDISLIETILGMSSSTDAEIPSYNLAEVSEILSTFLQRALDLDQQDRVENIVVLQERLNQLQAQFSHSLGRPVALESIDLIKPPLALRRSIGQPSTPTYPFDFDEPDSADKEDAADDDRPLLIDQGFDSISDPSSSSSSSSISSSSTASSTPSCSSSTQAACGICWELCDTDSFLSLASCPDRHHFCRDCLASFFISKIDEAAVNDLCCPSSRCHATPSESEILSLVPPATFQKYLDFVVLAVVRSDPNYRWCPKPSCSRAVKIDPSASSALCTGCNTAFCHKCSQYPHGATPCARVVSETEKEIKKWLQSIGTARAKRCPGCLELLEKISGCNHMTCRCGAQWCWLCRARVSDGGGVGGLFGDDDFFPPPQVDDEFQSVSDHFSDTGSRCSGLQFAAFDTVKEARWDEYGGKAKWREELERRRANQSGLYYPQRVLPVLPPPPVPSASNVPAPEREIDRVVTYIPPPVVARPRSQFNRRQRPPPNRQTILHN